MLVASLFHVGDFSIVELDRHVFVLVEDFIPQVGAGLWRAKRRLNLREDIPSFTSLT